MVLLGRSGVVVSSSVVAMTTLPEWQLSVVVVLCVVWCEVVAGGSVAQHADNKCIPKGAAQHHCGIMCR